MKVNRITSKGLIVVAIALSGLVALAANRRDRMKVTFSHPVHIQGDTLPPGKYTIETMSGEESNNNILDVYGPTKQHFKTSFSTIDAKKMGGADTTHVTLLKLDDDYYLDKVFIKGRVYGYQVVLPENVKSQASTGTSEDVPGTEG